MMRFVPKDANDLRAALERLSGDMPVGIDIAAGTVDELRRVGLLPTGLLVSIPLKSQVNLVTIERMK